MLKIFQVSDARSEQYEVTVNGVPAEISCATVSAVPYSMHWPGRQRPENQAERASFLRFEADERVDVAVTAKKPPSEALVRPLSAGVKTALEGRVVRFSLIRPGDYSLEINGMHGALHIFFLPARDYGVREGDAHTLYFGPGVHKAGEIRLSSHQTLYIAPEATVYGSVVALNAEDVRVYGYGILDGKYEKRSGAALIPTSEGEPFSMTDEAGFFKRREAFECPRGGVQLYGCKNVEIDGLTVRDTALSAVVCAACERVSIKNVKSVGMWKYNAGGVQLINAKNICVENCFIRAFDDCVAVKGMRGFDARVCENVKVRKCVLWCDWGREFLIGCETHADEIRNILFEDCDLIHGAHARIAILNQNRADVHHVEYRDIRAEFSREQQTPVYQTESRTPYRAPRVCEQPAMADFAVYDDYFSEDAGPNGSIHDILLKDIHLRAEEGLPMPEFRFQGLSAAHDIRGVHIDGLYNRGMRVAGFAKANIFVNAFASKVTFS